MQIRNISDAERDFGVLPHAVPAGGVVDVDDEVGAELVKQTDVWEATGAPSESPKERKARIAAEALAAFQAESAAEAAESTVTS